MTGAEPVATAELRPLAGERLAGEPPAVAEALLGVLLVRGLAGGRVVARIVETEAYGPGDPASHAARGRTAANASMFATAGTAYVYRSYGVHWCTNVAIGPQGTGAAVLLRAAVVLEGHEQVRRRRPNARTDAALLRGPGCLSAGMDLDARHDGADLLAGAAVLSLWDDGWRPGDGEIGRGPRTGVWRAPALPWRRWLVDCPAVSRYRRHPRS